MREGVSQTTHPKTASNTQYTLDRAELNRYNEHPPPRYWYKFRVPGYLTPELVSLFLKSEDKSDTLDIFGPSFYNSSSKSHFAPRGQGRAGLGLERKAWMMKTRRCCKLDVRGEREIDLGVERRQAPSIS